MVIIKLLMFVHYAPFLLGVIVYKHHVAQLNTISMCKASLFLVKHLDSYHSTDLLKINIPPDLSLLTGYRLELK